jgi:hypothetical protein
MHHRKAASGLLFFLAISSNRGQTPALGNFSKSGSEHISATAALSTMPADSFNKIGVRAHFCYRRAVNNACGLFRQKVL